MRCGKLKGYERLASTHGERVECAVVAVGSVGWRETGKLSPSYAVGQGRQIQAGLFPAGAVWEFSQSSFSFHLSTSGFPAAHTHLPSPVASALALSGLLPL